LWYPGQPETELRHRLATCGEAANPQSRSDKSSHIAVDGNFSSTVQLGRGKGPASAGAHGRKEGTSALGGCRRHGRHASELQGKQQLLLPDAKRREESGRCQRAGANEPERAGGSWQRRWWKRNRPREAPQAGGPSVYPARDDKSPDWRSAERTGGIETTLRRRVQTATSRNMTDCKAQSEQSGGDMGRLVAHSRGRNHESLRAAG
jgi:hypothetical protein